MEDKIEELIEIYGKRIESILRLIRITDSTIRISRLKAKLSCYRVTMSELEVIKKL